MPPTEKRKKRRPRASAIDLPIEVLPTPGGPTSRMIEPATSPFIIPTARKLEDPRLHVLQAVVVAVEHLARVAQVQPVLGVLAPGHSVIQSR